MKKRSNTENEAASARSHTGFNRVAGLVRASAEIARTTDRLAKIARQQIPFAATALVPRRGARTASRGRDGFQRSPGGDRHGVEGNTRQSMSADAIHAISGF